MRWVEVQVELTGQVALIDQIALVKELLSPSLFLEHLYDFNVGWFRCREEIGRGIAVLVGYQWRGTSFDERANCYRRRSEGRGTVS